MDEWILIAAIWYKQIPGPKDALPVNCDEGLVLTGYRHGHIIWTMASLTGLRTVTIAVDGVGEHVQGFLTSKNRFVGRKEAATIAYYAGQVLTDMGQLFSEDLY